MGHIKPAPSDPPKAVTRLLLDQLVKSARAVFDVRIRFGNDVVNGCDVAMEDVGRR